MKANNDYINKYWKKIILSFAFAIFLFIGGIVTKNYDVFAVFGIAFILAIANLIFQKRRFKGVLNNHFKNESPDQLINYYDKMFKKTKVEDKDAFLAYNKALVYCYYGVFEKAIELIDKIDWDKRVPYIQSLELSIRALINYIKPEDYKEGLRLSLLSKELGHFSNKVIGSDKSKEFYEAYVHMGELLSGNTNDTLIIRNLEEQFQSTAFYPKALIAWCLANTYNKLGMHEKSKEMMDYCKQTVPYCKPLITLI